MEQLKAKLFWRDEASEAAWCEKTGLSLLTFACASDDLRAVKALLATDEGKAMLVSRGKALKHTDKLPFNTLLRNLANKITPLKLAMGYGSPELLSELLAAGAPVPESDQEDLLLGSGCSCPCGA